jgi:hypothetical protein
VGETGLQREMCVYEIDHLEAAHGTLAARHAAMTNPED